MSATAVTAAAPAARPPQGLWHDALGRLLANRGATVGGCVFALIVVAALAAPLLAPYNPVTATDSGGTAGGQSAEAAVAGRIRRSTGWLSAG